MEDINKTQLGGIWAIVVVVSIASILVGIVMPDLGWIGMAVTPFMVILGILLTLTTQYFFDPLKQCPRCDTKIASVYTQKCNKCGLDLMIKCSDCDAYVSTYIEGKPIKYCRKCGSQLTKKIEEIEVSDTLQQYLEREAAADAKFCPSCGVRIDRDEVLHFCPLCGGSID